MMGGSERKETQVLLPKVLQGRWGSTGLETGLQDSVICNSKQVCTGMKEVPKGNRVSRYQCSVLLLALCHVPQAWSEVLRFSSDKKTSELLRARCWHRAAGIRSAHPQLGGQSRKDLTRAAAPEVFLL